MLNFTNMLAVDIMAKGCSNMGTGICALITQGLYGLLTLLCKVLGLFADLLNIAFFIVSGLDVSSSNVEGTNIYDITVAGSDAKKNLLDYFLFDQTVTKAYWWLALIGLLAVVIFTIYKIVKQDYFDRAGPRSKGPIFRNVAISCISFLLVIPIFWVIIHTSSLLAVAVMEAMGMSVTEFAGAKIFKLSWSDDDAAVMKIINAKLNGVDDRTTFAWMWDLNSQTLFSLMADGKYVAYDNEIISTLNLTPREWSGVLSEGGVVTDTGTYTATFYWYIYIVGVIVGIKALYKLMLAMIQRIFKLMGLFLVAPSPISQYVLDDGAKYKDWMKKSIQEGLRLVVASMSFSIYLMVLNLIKNIDFVSAFVAAKNEASVTENYELVNVTTGLLSYNAGEVVRTSAPMLGARDVLSEIANAFMRIFLLMGAGGAITDLDGVISPLLSGAAGSLESGETGKAAGAVGSAAAGLVTRAVGAAAGGALSLAKGAIGVAGSAIGGAAGAVTEGLDGAGDALEGASDPVDDGPGGGPGGGDNGPETNSPLATPTETGGHDQQESEEESTEKVQPTEQEQPTEEGSEEQSEEESTEEVQPTEQEQPTEEGSEEQSEESTEEVQPTEQEQPTEEGSEEQSEEGAPSPEAPQPSEGDPNATQSGTQDGNGNNQGQQSGNAGTAQNTPQATAQNAPANAKKDKRQARLARRRGWSKALKGIGKGLTTGWKDKNGKTVIPGLGTVLGHGLKFAGGMLGALKLGNLLTESGLVSEKMAKDFNGARTAGTAATDAFIEPGVSLAKKGLKEGGKALGRKIGTSWEQKRMDNEVENTATAKRHTAAVANVQAKSNELDTANANFATAQQYQDRCGEQYSELVQEQAAAEQTANDAAAGVQAAMGYGDNDRVKKEQLDKYIRGEINDEDVPESVLNSWKENGVEEARTARRIANQAADAAENGEVGEEGVLVRAGRKQYVDSVARATAAATNVTTKAGELNTAVQYAGQTREAYNKMYTESGTRRVESDTQEVTDENGNVVQKKAKKTYRDVTKGALGKNNKILDDATTKINDPNSNSAAGYSAPETPASSQEGIASQIRQLEAENDADRQSIATGQQRDAELGTQIGDIENRYAADEAALTTGTSGQGRTGKKIRGKLESAKNQETAGLTAERQQIANDRTSAESRINEREAKIEALRKMQGLTGPDAVTSKIDERIGAIDLELAPLRATQTANAQGLREAEDAYRRDASSQNQARVNEQRRIYNDTQTRIDGLQSERRALGASRRTITSIQGLQASAQQIPARQAEIAERQTEIDSRLAELNEQRTEITDNMASAKNASDRASRGGRGGGMTAQQRSANSATTKRKLATIETEIQKLETEKVTLRTEQERLSVQEQHIRMSSTDEKLQRASAVGATMVGYNYNVGQSQTTTVNATTGQTVTQATPVTASPQQGAQTTAQNAQQGAQQVRIDTDAITQAVAEGVAQGTQNMQTTAQNTPRNETVADVSSGVSSPTGSRRGGYTSEERSMDQRTHQVQTETQHTVEKMERKITDTNQKVSDIKRKVDKDED